MLSRATANLTARAMNYNLWRIVKRRNYADRNYRYGQDGPGRGQAQKDLQHQPLSRLAPRLSEARGSRRHALPQCRPNFLRYRRRMHHAFSRRRQSRDEAGYGGDDHRRLLLSVGEHRHRPDGFDGQPLRTFGSDPAYQLRATKRY